MRIEPEAWDDAPEWSDDCNGKKDYDGTLVAVESRYWPRGGGHMSFERGPDGLRELPQDMTIEPCAASSIRFCGVDIAQEEFTAETEEEVRKAVENWVAEQVERLRATLRAEYAFALSR